MKNMLKGRNLLILALVGGGVYWYWNKMKQDKAKKGGSMNFTGDLDLIDYQNAAGKVPTRGIRYGSQFNRAKDVRGVEYYVPNVSANGEPFVNAASGVKIVPRYGTTFAQSSFAAQNQNLPSWATAGPKR
jgi:hypothetical protein